MRKFFIDMCFQVGVICWVAATCVAAVALSAFFK